jgi:hypothetical protein
MDTMTAPSPQPPLLPPPDSTVGISGWLVASAGILCTGMVGGVYAITRHENFKLNPHSHRKPAMLAFQALAAGTVLAVGSFGLAGTAFVQFTGIDNMDKVCCMVPLLLLQLSEEFNMILCCRYIVSSGW